MAAQTAAGKDVDNNHVIDIDDGTPEPPECAVCMEPLEWVAVGACGHHAVCAACAVRLRFVQGDRRCCICRKYCLTVVVTKVAAGGGASGSERRAFAELVRVAVFFPAALGTQYWYHGGAKAYFDDEKQYEAATKACEDADGNGTRASRYCQPAVLLLIFIFLGICFLISFAIWRTI